MDFYDYYQELDAAGKRDLARRLDITIGYLYQVALGHREVSFSFIAKVPAATDYQVDPVPLLFERLRQEMGDEEYEHVMRSCGRYPATGQRRALVASP